MLDICHILLSEFFVVILRVDSPEEWPPLFGSAGEFHLAFSLFLLERTKMAIPEAPVHGRTA